MKIAISAISYNEEKHVNRFCESAKDADEICICDTGSSDDTASIAKQCGAQVNNIFISPWRFDHARNAALSLVSKDIDIIISLDLDEVMVDGWREEIERVWEKDTTRLKYLYDWGNGISYKYEKIFSRNGYFFWHPCHEYPRPDGRITEVWAQTDKLLVRHLPDASKSRSQYLQLLELSVKEDPSCPRNAFYYGRELFFNYKWREAIKALQRYIAMPNATWHVERSYAMRIISKCFEELGAMSEAEQLGRLAAGEDPNARESWCGLASFYYRQALWAECYASAVRALTVKERQFVYSDDPEVWGALPHDLASIAAWKIGLNQEAIDHCNRAIELDPNDERLKTNLSWFKGEKGG